MVYQGPAAITPGNTDQPAAPLITSLSCCVRHYTLGAPPPFPTPSSTNVYQRLLSSVTGLILAAAVSSKLLGNGAENGHMGREGSQVTDSRVKH